jgi:glycerol-3-phosphate acyltransferase PlsY
MDSLIAIPSAYLAGSIPFAYLAGRLFAHKDLRTAGTGSLGTHNVFHEVGRAAGVAVFFLDCAKMGLTLLVLRIVGASLWVQSLAALAVIAGHNWSVFTRFKGGRGMTVTLIGFAILLPWETLVVLTVLAFGLATRTIAMYCAFSLVLWPLLAVLRGEPAPLIFFAFGASLNCFARRLQGSPEVAPVPPSEARLSDVLFNRLILDREFTPAWLETDDSR